MLLDDLLNAIKKRAGAFLGNDKDLKSLSHFIDGFLFAKKFSNQYGISEDRFNHDFDKFLMSEMSEYDNIFFWDEKITTAYGDDAWDKFFELYDKFRESNFSDKNSADK